MASVVHCFSCSAKPTSSSAAPLLKPLTLTIGFAAFQSIHKLRTNTRFHSLKAKATEKNQETKKAQKSNSIVCTECEGNGAIQCSQCKGTGVNSEDHFNGQFKVGGLCWLCRGKREILCGNCNGAGFLGGFMSTFDETAD